MPDRQTEASVNEEVGLQSFEVTTSDGTYRRNRRDLIALPDPSDHSRTDTSDQTESTTPALTEPRRSGRITQPPERLDPSWVRIGH